MRTIIHVKKAILATMLTYGLSASAQTGNYSARVTSDILPWVESVGQLFGLAPEALDSMDWNPSYTSYCPKEQYDKMRDIVSNPAYYYCPTGYYRLRSERGGYLFLEGANVQTQNYGYNRQNRLSSVVRLERMSDGGFYIKMQGRYLQTPLKNQQVALADVPDKFYPVVKTPGQKVAFTTRMGDYAALHCGYNNVIGYSLSDDASYWTVSEATAFGVPTTASEAGKHYATLYAPFATRPEDGTQAFTMALQKGKAVATNRLDTIPACTGVVLRGDDDTLQVAIADDDHQNVAGNVVLRNDIADSAYYYFNKAFLIRSGEGYDDNTYYRVNLSSTDKLYFWQQALVILGVEDRYDFRGDQSQKSLITNLLDAFSAHEGSSSVKAGSVESSYAHSHGLSDWTWNEYNDDLLWAGLAYIRGYLITGQQRFLDQAKWTWDFMYKRGYDDTLGGGIWWDIRKQEKSGLSNNPAICMASYLFEATGDSTYLDKAKAIYTWVKSHLRRADGAVSEKMNANGSAVAAYNVYNQGTYIEGAAALYRITGDRTYRSDAMKTIEYVMVNQVDSRGIMSAWKSNGTYQSEFARGVAFLLQADPSLWQYRGNYTSNKVKITYWRWLRRNADAAWETRDHVNNITGCEWTKTTPTYPSTGNTWECDACVSSVVMTNAVPEKEPWKEQDDYVVLDDHSGAYANTDVKADTIALDAEGIMRAQQPVSVVCVGNSITEGIGASSSYYAWPAQMGRLLGEQYAVINRGVSGSTMGRKTDFPYWITDRYRQAKAANPQVLFIALGTNDADPKRWEKWGADFKSDYRAMIDEFRQNGRDPIIYCVLPPCNFPTTTSQLNNILENHICPLVRQVASEVGAYVVDFHSPTQDMRVLFPDNTHPNDVGATALATIASEAIRATQTLRGIATVSNGEVIDSTIAVVSNQGRVTLAPISGRSGAWNWTGPGGFTSTDSVLMLDKVTTGGTYTATFTDTNGHRSLINFLVSVKEHAAGAITPYIQATNGSLQQSDRLTVRPGYTVNFSPKAEDADDGSWVWRGPNGFLAFTRETSVPTMNSKKAGKYAVTHTDSQGRQATVVYTLSVEGTVWCEPLVPYVNVGDTWTKTTTAQVSVGTDVTFGPQPTDGNWTWTGPNGYTYTGREARLGSFSADKAGAYIATRTNEAGCHESVTFTLTLK